MKLELAKVQRMLDWLRIKLYLDSNSVSAKSRAVKRGQVYRCNFGCGIGSEMQKERPAVVIQNDVGNSRSGNTIVVPITHDSSSLPCMTLLTSQVDKSGNVILDGQANASNLMCVSKARLGDFICTLPTSDMKKIDESIAKTIGLMGYYATILKKLESKSIFLDQVKYERNKAQDELIEIRKIFGIGADDSLVDYVKNVRQSLDRCKENG